LTTIIHINEELNKPAEVLRNGGTVIFPTETVYGLGANALDPDAVKKIFIAKGRPSDNPLIVHIDSFEKIYDLVEEVPENAKKLAEAYWPGPMTLILKKKSIIPNEVSAGLDTVGIRIPRDETARELIKLAGVSVAAPSANLSGSPSPTTFNHVMNDMYGRVDVIIEGESAEVGLESTVIDVTGEVPTILRPGGITPEMIKAVCGDVIIDKKIDGANEGEKVKSPGMKYRHYSPKAEVYLVDKDEIQDKISDINDKKILLLLTEEEKYNVDSVVMGRDLEEIAKNIFGLLRKSDEDGYDVVIIEKVKEEGIGLAIMNRLKRAAKH